MAKDKLRKFAEISTLSNVFQNFTWPEVSLQNYKGEILEMKGLWHKHFENEHPLILELACGRGDYSLGMAKVFPDKNFIGIDIKGNRIWSGAKEALQEDLHNVAFIRTRIEELTHYFGKGEVDEIWITFPDPFLKDRQRRNRLTYTRFLNIYQQILKPDGVVHLKTDSTELYEFTMEMLEEQKCVVLIDNNDIYHKGYEESLLDIKTKYEKMHLAKGKTIKYLKFGFR